jgi:hypothetical protein
METCNKLKTAEIKRFIDKLEKLEDLGIFSAIRKDSEGRWLVDGVHYVENRLMKDNELIEWFDSVKIHEFVHDFSKLVTDEKSVDEALDFIKSIDPGGNLAILFCTEITKRKGVYIVNDREYGEVEVLDTKEFIVYIKDIFKYIADRREGIEYFLKSWDQYDSINKFSLLKKLNDELKEIQLL